ncbi:carboxymuconolactone decarboxylase family protein [Roseomonas hellenica]|uniref:Carboxymuconolactone decarboxylase family protein n=1 Tax=Plastoroseomonas hellenica TaxID=2687306 RepID=A0ABS5EXQ8_9PROT|nr:carboxymuconolactone decarboxylase family protein [Plastoroseomonas hellenica]MBR0665074.1 carboxymuconolactone decarboxylase family protein [Plastoroseomonas hellenica]
MARIPYRTVEDLAPENKDLLKRGIALHRALVNSPGGARAFQGLGQYIRYGSKLDPRLREIAILQVGWLAQSAYEWSHHVKIGMDFGVTESDIRAIMAGDDAALEPRAQLVLRAAREMVAGPGTSQATHDALAAEFDTEHLTDLILVIGFYCAVVRVLASLAIDVEPDYQPYLDRFPLKDK